MQYKRRSNLPVPCSTEALIPSKQRRPDFAQKSCSLKRHPNDQIPLKQKKGSVVQLHVVEELRQHNGKLHLHVKSSSSRIFWYWRIQLQSLHMSLTSLLQPISWTENLQESWKHARTLQDAVRPLIQKLLYTTGTGFLCLSRQ